MKEYEKIFNISRLDGFEVDAAFQLIGSLIDLSLDLRRLDGTEKALTWCDELEARDIAQNELAILDYFRANAWHNKFSLSDQEKTWDWDCPEVLQQLFYLRRSINNPAFEELVEQRRCQILTNLANQLDFIGRFVESQEYWTKALSVDPNFWMALGNRGRGKYFYSNLLYADTAKAGMLWFAQEDLAKTQELAQQYPLLGEEYARALYTEKLLTVQSIIKRANIVRTREGKKESDLGESAEERHYRQWCLQNRLFLNPLNDASDDPAFAEDVLLLPNFVTGIDEPPTPISFFNQLKQEFASARWLYYEGITNSDIHFSDSRVLLLNTLDYPSYGLTAEKLKIAFRITYSLFDKIAFFLNAYMRLGVRERDVNFRHIWYEKDRATVRSQFAQSKNWPFRGLFWLSKDLFDESLRDVAEPDARELYDIRNHLEHKYIKIHRRISVALNIDESLYSITQDTFEEKGLRLLKLARAALIYLSLGMHIEEGGRETRGNTPAEGNLIAPITLDSWDDEWKRRF